VDAAPDGAAGHASHLPLAPAVRLSTCRKQINMIGRQTLAMQWYSKHIMTSFQLLRRNNRRVVGIGVFYEIGPEAM
jgi:hypothetical protein